MPKSAKTSLKQAKAQLKAAEAEKAAAQAKAAEPVIKDSDLFAHTMANLSGVVPNADDRADLRPASPKRKAKDINHATRQAAAVTAPETVIDHLSSEGAAMLSSQDELVFAAPGIQLGLLQKLKKGHIPWDEGIDLHGLTVDEARDALSRFVRQAAQAQSRCLLVVHGKGQSQGGNEATLKSYTNEWLRRLHPVVAFASAQPKDGGTGAVYVLLKRPDAHREAQKTTYRQR